MAELIQNAGNPSGKIRSRKLTSKVDLTAMVDLAFLLITFFMLTTSLSKPASMQLAMPEPNGKPSPVDENRTMTILLTGGNKAKWFMGKFSEADPKEITLGSNALRKELLLQKTNVLGYSNSQGTPEKGLIVLIKPGKNSNYGNLVEVLDEMAITNVETYAITDLEAPEKRLLAGIN